MGSAPGSNPGAGAIEPRDAPRVVRALLSELLTTSDSLGDAVRLHDHDAILGAVRRADGIMGELDRCTPAVASARAIGAFEDMDAELLALRDALRVAARRNAMLIERAWQLDAATLRLLAGLGRGTTTGPAGAYRDSSAPTYLDTPA